MERQAAIEEIRGRWREFYPAAKVKGQIICPLCGHGTHGDGIKENPKSKNKHSLKCFGACGFSGDVLDLIQKDRGCDFNEALQAAADQLGIVIDNDNAGEGPQRPRKPAGDKIPAKEEKAPESAPESVSDYTAYYETCAKRIEDPEAAAYLEKRGISQDTAFLYGLGYDPAWISPAAVKKLEAEGNPWRPSPTKRIIIPVSRNHYIARAMDPAVEKYAKPNETGGGSAGIFNEKALYSEAKVVFVTEGAFDALSVIEAGAAAVALNSTNMVSRFLEGLRARPTKAVLVICQDTDGAGQGAAEDLRQGLNELGIPFLSADICGEYKDPNEALTNDRAGFIEKVRLAAQDAKALEQEAPADIPGLLRFEDIIQEFAQADDEIINIKSFPTFSKTAKIKKHSSVVIAADTGGGKSSLALNFLNDLNNNYPCIYFNLEMDRLTVLRRLVSIQSGIELDRIEGYKTDPNTAAAVDIYIKGITNREPVQVIQDTYLLPEIERIIKKSTEGRDVPTMVFIDHSLLVEIDSHASGRYERFTLVSERLRKIALKYNIVLFVLLQQSRAGKADDEERPKNSSLKESGSWENDATHICFLWYDTKARRKLLLLTKNRGGDQGEFVLNYWRKTQTYAEAKTPAAGTENTAPARKTSRRGKAQEKLITAYNNAVTATGGNPTLLSIAEAADVSTSTVKSWIKEYGGCIVDGVSIDPAGLNTEVEYTGFIKLTPADDDPFKDAGASETPAKKKTRL